MFLRRLLGGGGSPKGSQVRVQARVPAPRERILVASGDAAFWCAVRRESPEIEGSWVLANSARECLSAVEDPRVRIVILDGTLSDKPASQLLPLLRQIRPDLLIVFAFQSPSDDDERGAREAGVLYYGDRAQISNMVHVVRQNLHRVAMRHTRPRSGGAPAEGMTERS
jgi:DNA-binding response OmpR family regulator